MRGVRAPSDLARVGSLYRETVVALNGSADPEELGGLARGLQTSFGREPDATSENAADVMRALPVGRVSALSENADEFRAIAVFDAGRESARIATATWAKTPFDIWWRGASSAFPPVVPSPRYLHTAVWTGSRMVVWGGQKPNVSTVKYRDGASYDPALDRWFTTSVSGAPSVRDKHIAVWDGGRMIVWGGMGAGSRTLNSGATYCSCSFYADVDGDGYGNPASLLRDCSFVTPRAHDRHGLVR